jgi:hypothetical protein
MKAIFTAIILSLLLSGCSLFHNRPVLPEEAKVIVIDQEYYKECDPLKSLEVQTFESVLENVIDNVAIYKKCKDKQHNSILLLKKFTNVKD